MLELGSDNWEENLEDCTDYSQIFPDAFVHFCAHCIEAIWFGSQNRREPQRDRQGREKLSFLLGQVPKWRAGFILYGSSPEEDKKLT